MKNTSLKVKSMIVRFLVTNKEIYQWIGIRKYCLKLQNWGKSKYYNNIELTLF